MKHRWQLIRKDGTAIAEISADFVVDALSAIGWHIEDVQIRLVYPHEYLIRQVVAGLIGPENGKKIVPGLKGGL